jgi:Zn-dependent protease with chaperone function
LQPYQGAMTVRVASRLCGVALVVSFLALAQGTASQTTLAPARNSYSAEEEVALGHDAAAEVQRRIAVVEDPLVGGYLQALGMRLVGTLPASLRRSGFSYSFAVLDMHDVGSFAFPGGPVLVSRGMMQAVGSEGELAGLLAHQAGHVALRHATAQATGGERFQIGAISGEMIGAVAAGARADILALGTRFGVRSYFLMYDPEYERQADLLATQMMASAGYDPRDIGAVFRRFGRPLMGHGAWQWTQSHPDLNNGEDDVSRDDFISRAAERLGIARSATLHGRFDLAQLRLRELPPAPTFGRQGVGAGHAQGVGVVGPSGTYRLEPAGDMLEVRVPVNGSRVVAGNTVTFAPDRPFEESSTGPPLFTHGVQVGIARSTTGYLEDDTLALVESFRLGNPALRWGAVYRATTIGGRAGIMTTASNVSPIGGSFEYVLVSTAHLPDGGLLYVIGIAPEEEAGVYRRTYERILGSIRVVE